jgi:hypothetical protein
MSAWSIISLSPPVPKHSLWPKKAFFEINQNFTCLAGFAFVEWRALLNPNSGATHGSPCVGSPDVWEQCLHANNKPSRFANLQNVVSGSNPCWVSLRF